MSRENVKLPWYRSWPVLLLFVPAGVAIWSGWVGLGEMCGYGLVTPLPGIADWQINSAITLPIGVEAYAAYALYAWLTGGLAGGARRFAIGSAIGALVLGMAGQVAYHLLRAEHDARVARLVEGLPADAATRIRAAQEALLAGSAPAWVTTAVSCLPVLVLGMGAALFHLVREQRKAVSGSADQLSLEPASPVEQAEQVLADYWADLSPVWDGYDEWAEQEERVREAAREKAAAEAAAAERIAQARAERDAEKAARIGMWSRLAAVLTQVGEKPTEAELQAWLELRLEATGSVPSRDAVRQHFKPAPSSEVIDRLRREVAQAAQDQAAQSVPETTSEGA